MAESITIARPYAEAVFKLAKEKNSLSHWSEMLSNAVQITEVAPVQELIGNPNVSASKLKEIIFNIGGSKLDGEVKNLLSVLIDNDRVTIIPRLVEMYEQLRANHEGVLEANIISAFSMSDRQLEKLVAALENKFNRKVKAKVSIDQELIGGVKIEIGDEVIDSSISGKLEAMSIALKS